MGVRLMVLAGLASSVAALAPAPAMAQYNFLNDRATAWRSADDTRLMRNAIGTVLRQYTDGATQAWTSPRSGRTGTVTLVRTFSSGGNRCADVKHEGGGLRYQLALCQIKGEWRISE